MKTQTLLPWMCVVALTAGVAALYLSGQKKDEELTRLRPESEQARGLQTQLDEKTVQLKSQEEELASLRQDKEDLLRLRNEVRQLQEAKQQLATQAAAAQANADRAEAKAAQATQAGAQQLQQLQSENQQLKSAAVQTQQSAQREVLICITNLRRLSNAKQQWAADHGKTADAVPSAQDLAPYFNNTLPACPTGGAYTLNAVNQDPTCSIAGHALPKNQ
jgi:chromosome segregation ATPase